MINYDIFTQDEKAIYSLRALYSKSGYLPYKMSKFEEYDLYSSNKDFLVSEGVITFTDTNGKLLALKPDVTMSIIKSFKGEGVEKYYYNENVYRVSQSTGSYKEIMQTGVECIGSISDENVAQVVSLAIESLLQFSTECVLAISHEGFVESVLSYYGIKDGKKKSVIKAIAEKNATALQNACDCWQSLMPLVLPYQNLDDYLFQLKNLAISNQSQEYLAELKFVCDSIKSEGNQDKIAIDFSISNPTGYYSGVVFKGFINGISSAVLSGGRYDKLVERMNKKGGAVGFAVYLDNLQRINEAKSDDYVNVALPKGRLGEKVYEMFEKAGFECPSIKEQTRKLIFENKEKKIRYFWVKPSDVAIYVERGAADIGVAGKDILLEYVPDVFELLDLNIGKCRMAVASKKDFVDDESKTLIVATKFSNIAKNYYAKKGRDIDIIHLNGSIEIAPILGLSDVIVDIVETGTTLKENDLEVIETIFPISARLIANKSGFKFKTAEIETLVSKVKALIG